MASRRQEKQKIEKRSEGCGGRRTLYCSPRVPVAYGSEKKKNVGYLGRKLAISWKSKLPSAAATGASYFQKMALALPSSIMHSGIQNRNKDGFVGQVTMFVAVNNGLFFYYFFFSFYTFYYFIVSFRCARLLLSTLLYILSLINKIK